MNKNNCVISFKVENKLSDMEIKQGFKSLGSRHFLSISNMVFGYSYPVSKGLSNACIFTNIEHAKAFIEFQKDIFNVISKYTSEVYILDMNLNFIESILIKDS